MTQAKHFMTVNELGENLYAVDLYNYSIKGKEKIFSKISKSIPRLNDILTEHYGKMIV